MIERYQLLIVSQHYEIYKQLIEQARLPGLSIMAFDDPEQAIRNGYDCDLVFGEPSLISHVVKSLPNLKWAQASWAGVEPLLLPNMRRDYILTNARNVYGLMMAEYVFGYLLMIERRIQLRWQAQLEKKWDDRPSGTLNHKILGLLGVGTIGAYLAATAHHFEMKTYGYTRQSEACKNVDRYFHENSWNSFAANLDYLVCSLPGTTRTIGIVNADRLSALPPRTWLVNIGRGSTIEELALVNALNRGALAGAILDVFREEPLRPDHPLWSTPNTFITYHTAARNYPPDIATIFIKNYTRFRRGKPLLYQVDFEQGY